MRYQVIALEYESDRVIAVCIPICAFEFLCGFSADDKVAVGVSVKTAYNVSKRGLATSRLTEYRHELAFSEVNADASECVDLFVSDFVILCYVFQL